MFFLDIGFFLKWGYFVKIILFDFGCLLQEGQPVARFGPMDDPIPKVEYYSFLIHSSLWQHFSFHIGSLSMLFYCNALQFCLEKAI